MRALFITHAFYPNHKSGGVYQRMLMFVDALKEIEYIDMLFFVAEDIEISEQSVKKYEEILRKKWHPGINLFLCRQSTEYLKRSKLHRKFRGIFDFQEQEIVAATSGREQLVAFESCLENNPDFILVNYLTSTLPILKTKRKLPPILFDLNDIEHKKLISLINEPMSNPLTKLYNFQLDQLKKGECAVIKAVQKTFVCSSLDQRYLIDSLGLSNIEVIPNSTVLYKPQEIIEQSSIIFVGSYGYLPNIKAANYMVEQVFPLVRAVIPNAILKIVGGTPENIPAYYQRNEGVEFTGFVDELTDLYLKSRVFCCPVFSGSGTRVKLLEAGAYGKPIVSTTLGAEGLGLINEYSFLEANTAEQLANACIRLIRDDILCKKLSLNSYQLVQDNYQRSHVVQTIKDQIKMTFRPSN